MEPNEMKPIDLTLIEAEARRMRAEAFRDLFASLGRGVAGLFRAPAKAARHA